MLEPHAALGRQFFLLQGTLFFTRAVVTYCIVCIFAILCEHPAFQNPATLFPSERVHIDEDEVKVVDGRGRKVIIYT